MQMTFEHTLKHFSKYLLCVLLALFSTSLYGTTKTHEDDHRDVLYLLTIPKSGTHLIEKYFSLLKNSLGVDSLNIRRSHMSESYLKLPKGYFQTQPEVKKIILIRDIRDVMVSLLDYIEKVRHYLVHKIRFSKRWDQLSRKEKLAQLIAYDSSCGDDILWIHHDKTLAYKQHEFIQRAITYAKFPNTQVVRYEHLAGPKAQAVTTEMCIEQLQRMHTFLGIDIDDTGMEYIVENLWGKQNMNTKYFNVGVAGRWREEFDEDLIALFKHYYGQELIELGYEKDNHW